MRRLTGLYSAPQGEVGIALAWLQWRLSGLKAILMPEHEKVHGPQK
jgi:hypothetical protein